MSEKAVSEVVGVLMVIAIITATAGMLYVLSYPILNDSEENVKFRKAYFEMLELKEKIENVRLSLEPNATYTARLIGVSLTFENSPIITINGTQYIVSSIRFSGSGWSVYYENGAIIERRGTWSKILQYPNIHYDSGSDTLTMPVIIFVGNKSVGGEGRVTISLSITNVTRLEVDNCEIKISSSNIDAWKEFFDDIGLSVPPPSDNTITFTVSKLSSTIYEVSVR